MHTFNHPSSVSTPSTEAQQLALNLIIIGCIWQLENVRNGN